MYQVKGSNPIKNSIIRNLIILFTQLENGNVTRENIAEVDMNDLNERFMFKENVTIEIIWPGNILLIIPHGRYLPCTIYHTAH